MKLDVCITNGESKKDKEEVVVVKAVRVQIVSDGESTNSFSVICIHQCLYIPSLCLFAPHIAACLECYLHSSPYVATFIMGL